MQTIQIENSLYNDLMKYGIDIQEELKHAIAKYKASKKFQEDKRYFEQSLADIEAGKEMLLDSKSYKEDMHSFAEELRAKYGDS